MIIVNEDHCSLSGGMKCREGKNRCGEKWRICCGLGTKVVVLLTKGIDSEDEKLIHPRAFWSVVMT